METMTQPKITGCRQLNEDEAALMNAIKAKGAEIDTLLKDVHLHLGGQAIAAAADIVETRRIENAQPGRWTSIARTDFQTALMALTRAVAQPTTF